jgi:hypothetical protein
MTCNFERDRPSVQGKRAPAARPKRGEVKNGPAHRRCAAPPSSRRPGVAHRSNRSFSPVATGDTRSPWPPLPCLTPVPHSHFSRGKNIFFFEAPRRGEKGFDRRPRRSNAAACSSRPAGASLRPRRRSAPARPSPGERLASSGPPPTVSRFAGGFRSAQGASSHRVPYGLRSPLVVGRGEVFA